MMGFSPMEDRNHGMHEWGRNLSEHPWFRRGNKSVPHAPNLKARARFRWRAGSSARRHEQSVSVSIFKAEEQLRASGAIMCAPHASACVPVQAGSIIKSLTLSCLMHRIYTELPETYVIYIKKAFTLNFHYCRRVNQTAQLYAHKGYFLRSSLKCV